MQVQEVPPGALDPLATMDEDYEKAVLHLAWARFGPTNDRTLLFALVELLPIEVPPPLDDGEQSERIDADGHSSVHVRRHVVTARDAVAWYLGCRRGIAVVPGDDGSLRATDDPDAERFALADLGEEPPWPGLVCVDQEQDDGGNTIPFCPAWHATPRVHHLVPLVDVSLEKLWSREEDREKVIQWLSWRLHFRLDEYPEYWGSLHLVAPNPMYRRVEERLFLTRNPPSEAVFLRFEPRAEKSVEGLELTYSESHPWGTRDIRRVVLRSLLVRLRFDHRVDTTQRMVLDSQRGTIEKETGYRLFLGGHAEIPKLASATQRIWAARHQREKHREAKRGGAST